MTKGKRILDLTLFLFGRHAVYKLIAKTYIVLSQPGVGPQIVEPYRWSKGKLEPQVIQFEGIPNEAMCPENWQSSIIYWAYKRTFGPKIEQPVLSHEGMRFVNAANRKSFPRPNLEEFYPNMPRRKV